MNLHQPYKFISYKLNEIYRKFRYNYYLTNLIERKRNRELLSSVRKNIRISKEPLVSVCIPTYNRGRILVERAINSVLNQTYQKFEVIIVGDNCTDDTQKLVEEIGDPRIIFVNLPKRGDYPINPMDRWRVAGVVPRNKALEIASGEWIAPLDDDDEFTRDHIEVLLNFAIEKGFEMVYGITEMEIKPGLWVKIGEYPPKHGKICHSSVLYHSILKFFKYDINSWKYSEPADWNLWRRMWEAGVKIGFINKVVAKHYLERSRWGI